MIPLLLSRVALATFDIADVHIDELEKIRSRASGTESGLRTFAQAGTEPSFRLGELPVHVQTLYDSAQTEWNQLFDHPFPAQMASGTATLNGFRHYMIQDAKYLEYYARVRMQSIANSGSQASFEEIVKFADKLSKSLGYSTDMRNICIQQLGVPKEVVTNEEPSSQLNNSIQLYESVVENPLGDWLAMHIVLLPCIMGYYAIASRLLEQPKVVTNTPYYPLWIQTNASPSTFERYIKLINDKIEERPDDQRHWDYWIELFKSACGTERDFLDLGLTNNSYDSIADGTYTICNSGSGLFLAAVDDGVIMQESSDGSVNWIFSPSERGYDIKNTQTQTSLTAVVRAEFPEYYDVYVTNEGDPRWSINTISTPRGIGYQLFWSPQMQYVLSADISGRYSKVIAADNYKGTNQMWIIA